MMAETYSRVINEVRVYMLPTHAVEVCICCPTMLSLTVSLTPFAEFQELLIRLW